MAWLERIFNLEVIIDQIFDFIESHGKRLVEHDARFLRMEAELRETRAVAERAVTRWQEVSDLAGHAGTASVASTLGSAPPGPSQDAEVMTARILRAVEERLGSSEFVKSLVEEKVRKLVLAGDIDPMIDRAFDDLDYETLIEKVANGVVPKILEADKSEIIEGIVNRVYEDVDLDDVVNGVVEDLSNRVQISLAKK